MKDFRRSGREGVASIACVRRGAIGVASLVGVLLLAPVDARAQCGTAASSCIDCHESQRQRSVLDDPAPWHRDHSFGSFCQPCHGGDPSALDVAAAHATLVDPLGDAPNRCAGCHGADATSFAARYRSIHAVPRCATASRPINAPRARHDTTMAVLVVGLGAAGVAFVSWNEHRLRRARGHDGESIGD